MPTKLKIRDNVIYDQDGNRVGGIDADAGPDVAATIVLGVDLIEPVVAFIAEVNSGSLKPKTAVDRFNKVLERHE